jgi:hypothetical protein
MMWYRRQSKSQLVALELYDLYPCVYVPESEYWWTSKTRLDLLPSRLVILFRAAAEPLSTNILAWVFFQCISMGIKCWDDISMCQSKPESWTPIFGAQTQVYTTTSTALFLIEQL